MQRSFGSVSRGRSFAVCATSALILGLGCGTERQKPESRPTTPVVVTAKIEQPQPLAEEGKPEAPPPSAATHPTAHKFGIEGPQAAGDPHMARESARDEAKKAGIIGQRATAESEAPSGADALGNDPMSGLGALMGDQVNQLMVGQPMSAPAPAPMKRRSANSIGMGGLSVSGTGSGYGAGGGGLGLRGRGSAVGPKAFIPPAPSADMNTERYAHAADNAFHLTKDSPLSTFSIDVDTAAYANVRRFLRDGALPPVDAVRIEELVNYFSYDYPEPKADEPVSVTTEVAAAPWAPDHRVVRIGLKTRAIDSSRAPASNLVFLIDVSGSMSDPDKLPLLKRGMSMLAQNLRPEDRVAIVVYAGASGLVLPSTPGSRRADVLSALERLDAGGSTNGADGIRLAYQVAREHFVKGGTNRVILATDGDFNVGTTSQGELVRLIENERKSGVFLTVLGFGRGNLNDSGMESLADHGNGSYAYIDSIAEAHKVLVREAGSTLITVAKDVKLQIEWNPTRVSSYRLIGFENRILAARDFNDDKKDAGELGAGHTMTALYEIVPQTAATSNKSEVDPLKYQAQAQTAAASSDELMTLKIRYKRPEADASRLMTQAIRDRAPDAQASTDFRWAESVACFGMLLRSSEHKGNANIALCDSLARGALGADPEGQRHELVSLMEQAKRLGLGASVAAPAQKTAQIAR